MTHAIQAMGADLHPLWYCPKCCASGGMILPQVIDVLDAVLAIREAHLKKSPRCMNDVRVLDPQDWYAQVKTITGGGQDPEKKVRQAGSAESSGADT